MFHEFELLSLLDFLQLVNIVKRIFMKLSLEVQQLFVRVLQNME